MGAELWIGMALSIITGAKEDVETICYDKPCIHMDGYKRIF